MTRVSPAVTLIVPVRGQALTGFMAGVGAGQLVDLTKLAATPASVCCMADSPAKLLFADQMAVRVHVPVLLCMVIVAVAGLIPLMGPTVHTVVAEEVMVGAAMPVAVVVAVTMKVLLIGAVAGAPVKVTRGVARTAVVCCVAVAAKNVVVSGQLAVRAQAPTPLCMVTTAVELRGVPLTAPTVQTLAFPDVIVGRTLLVVDAVTVKLVPKAAVAGAPANDTVGVSLVHVAPAQAMLENNEARVVVWKAPAPNESGDCGIKSSMA